MARNEGGAMTQVLKSQGQAEICGKAMAEAAGFCWENCAQSQWIRDAEAGLKAVGHAALLAERDRLRAALEPIVDCYGMGASPETFCKNVHDHIMDVRDVLRSLSTARQSSEPASGDRT